MPRSAEAITSSNPRDASTAEKYDLSIFMGAAQFFWY
jgi:hypothetical protein